MNRFACNIARLKPIPLALAALLGTNLAWAQTPPPATAGAEAEPALKLETVIVKAQRRAERLQDVPVAVKAFSARQIEDAGIKSTQDFINLTPNMSIDNAQDYGNSYVVIRGLTSFNGADFPVAVVVDGVPQGNQRQLKMNLFDVQSIEVLKGPQGALYGRNAIGGAVNIETRKPRNKFEGVAGLEVGNGGAVELSGGIGGALVDDRVLLRIIGQAKKADGLIGNTYLGQNVDRIDHDNSLRAKLTVVASDSVTLDLNASINDYRAGANWDSIVNPPGVVRTPNDIVYPRSNMLGKSWGRTEDFSFKADVETAAGTITAISAVTKLGSHYRGDVDFSNPTDLPKGFLGLCAVPGVAFCQMGQGQSGDVTLTSQEVRMTSPGKQALRWIAGGYYLNTRRDNTLKLFHDNNGQIAQYDLAGAAIEKRESNDNTASAAFGQLDYDIRPDLTLSGALRFDRDERKQTDLIAKAERTNTYDSWQPKVTLTRKFSPDMLSYATYSTGFRSGGFNTPGDPDFRAETLKNYEIGSKSTLLENRLILNAALFFSQSTDFQYFHVDIATGSPLIANIDKVDIKGLDVDFRYAPAKGWQLDGGLGVTRSTIKRNTSDPTTVGNYTPKANPFKANLGVQYTRRLLPNVDGSVRIDAEHRGKKYWFADNAAVSDAIDLINLRIGLNEIKDRWSVNLFARNLTDKKYYADYNASKYSTLSYDVTSPVPMPLDIGSLGTPRTFGVEARLRF